MALGISSPTRVEDSSQLVATSQTSLWAAMPDNTMLIIQPPKAVCTPTTPPTKTPGADMGALPEEVILLQEERNSVMGHLLMTRVSIDAHQRKQVSDFKMVICQNEAEATDAIGETKAHCGVTIREVEIHCAKTIREAEAHSSTTIMEVEAHCAADIREVESHCADHACAIQQFHSDKMQCLEREAIEEEEKDWQSFLATCGMALQVCPLEAHGVLMWPLQLLMGNMSLAAVLAIPPQVSIAREEPTPVISHPATPAAPASSSGTKQWHHLPDQAACSPWPTDEVPEASEEPPHQKWKDSMPLNTLLKGGQGEAFSKDSDLVQQAREAYFSTSHPDFDCKVPHNLASLFWYIIISASLLDSKIYEIQEIWTGQEDLWYANDALKSLQKGLWFFCLISPLESTKVMGMKGVHHPDTLHHFTRLTFCPWCGKEGQNKGTMVNHLWTTHYELGLVCNQCLNFLLITLEATQCHGQCCKTAQGK